MGDWARENGGVHKLDDQDEGVFQAEARKLRHVIYKQFTVTTAKFRREVTGYEPGVVNVCNGYAEESEFHSVSL